MPCKTSGQHFKRGGARKGIGGSRIKWGKFFLAKGAGGAEGRLYFRYFIGPTIEFLTTDKHEFFKTSRMNPCLSVSLHLCESVVSYFRFFARAIDRKIFFGPKNDKINEKNKKSNPLRALCASAPLREKKLTK